MDEEREAVQNLLKEKEIKQIYNLKFIIGK